MYRKEKIIICTSYSIEQNNTVKCTFEEFFGLR